MTHSVFLLLGLLGCTAPSTDVSGVWQGQATDPLGNPADLTVTLSANGGALTGTVLGPPPDSAHGISNGRLDGNKVSFTIAMGGPDGPPHEFRLAATLAGNQMRGVVTDPASGDTFPFTLTKYNGSLPRRADAPGGRSVQHALDLPPPDPAGNDPTPVEPQAAILAAFDRYDVVAIGSVAHGTQDLDGFVLALVRNPALPRKVNDIAVECGNSLYQPLLDRYIAGEDVPLVEVRQVWRNVTTPSCGFSGFYEQLFPLVRRVNERLPPEERLRVLASDPPVDWSKVKGPEDIRPFTDRDRSIAGVMEREVLAKNRKALMLFGINHLRHGRNAVGAYEVRYPGVTLVIAEHHGFGGPTPLARYNDQLEKRMAAWPIPSLVSLEGSWLGNLSSDYFDPGDAGRDNRGYRGVDSYLYLGPRDLLLREPVPAGIVLDKAYMAERRRRAIALGEPDGPQDPEVIFKRELESSAFLQDPPAREGQSQPRP